YVYPNYRVNKGIAVSAVSYLLQNIMQRDAYKRLASKHLEQGRIKGGVSTYRKKMGIFGRSTKEFMDDSSKGGIKALSERKGIHSLSPEEVSSNTIKSLIARGFNPFNNEVKSTEFGHIAEKYYIIALRFTGQYDYYRGWQYVTMKVNALYNKNRTPKQVRDFYYDWIKRFSLKMDKESFEAF
ncbi:hypothetical protein HYX18_03735, partial [Candidatus Woesearchaeota archaeon]|nr:hypothetical protein [Candidatus Woesearchaeota archaeon]